MAFLRERFKNLLKDKKIRNDIIEAVDSSHTDHNFLTLYKKCSIINKNISKDVCKNIIEAYKRASNIIEQELKSKNEKVLGQPESFLFKKERSVCLQSSHFLEGIPISKNFEKAFFLELINLSGKYLRDKILSNSFW